MSGRTFGPTLIALVLVPRLLLAQVGVSPCAGRRAAEHAVSLVAPAVDSRDRSARGAERRTAAASALPDVFSRGSRLSRSQAVRRRRGRSARQSLSSAWTMRGHLRSFRNFATCATARPRVSRRAIASATICSTSSGDTLGGATRISPSTAAGRDGTTSRRCMTRRRTTTRSVCRRSMAASEPAG